MAGGSSTSSGGVPPGFRFHPTDEELLHFYLKKKISFQKFDMEVIREVDLNKIEPWELQERCKIGSTPQNEWYFFSHKDRKYPTGSRTNRATSAGFWKATGRDKCIRNSFKKMGMRKTLVFYRGRAPHGQKTDWIMHEYRLEDSDSDHDHNHNDPQPATHHEDGWVICRVFKKKNLFKINGTSNSTSHELGGAAGHHYHHHHHRHNNNNNNGGMMMMMNADDDQVNMSSASTSAITSRSAGANIFNSMNPHQYLQVQAQAQAQAHDLNSYSHHHHIPLMPPQLHHQYTATATQTQIEAAQNFVSNHNNTIKAPAAALMMLSSPNSTYDDHLSTAADVYSKNDDENMQVKQFMSSSCSRDDHDQCETAASPTPTGNYQCDVAHHNLNEWDRLTNPPPPTSNNINQLSLRTTHIQDFWAYGK